MVDEIYESLIADEEIKNELVELCREADARGGHTVSCSHIDDEEDSLYILSQDRDIAIETAKDFGYKITRERSLGDRMLIFIEKEERMVPDDIL